MRTKNRIKEQLTPWATVQAWAPVTTAILTSFATCQDHKPDNRPRVALTASRVLYLPLGDVSGPARILHPTGRNKPRDSDNRRRVLHPRGGCQGSRDNQTGNTKHTTQARRRRDVTQAPGRYISECLKGHTGPQEKTPAIACKRLFFCFNTWARSRPGGVETRRGCQHIEV